MRTIAYVDGFNLYYRALKAQPSLKWLNLTEFVLRFVRPGDSLGGVKYFSAPVSGRKDPGAPIRQQMYFRALKTLPEVEIFYGSFMNKEICRPLVKEIPLAQPQSPDGQYMWVRTTEEKGSDVNLASYLLRDAFTGRMDAAFVVSADTDLVEPIRIVSQEIGLPVGIINPAVDRPVPPKIGEVASFVRHISLKDLRESQFPATVPKAGGKPIQRPLSWA